MHVAYGAAWLAWYVGAARAVLLAWCAWYMVWCSDVWCGVWAVCGRGGAARGGRLHCWPGLHLARLRIPHFYRRYSLVIPSFRQLKFAKRIVFVGLFSGGENE